MNSSAHLNLMPIENDKETEKNLLNVVRNVSKIPKRFLVLV